MLPIWADPTIFTERVAFAWWPRRIYRLGGAMDPNVYPGRLIWLHDVVLSGTLRGEIAYEHRQGAGDIGHRLMH